MLSGDRQNRTEQMSMGEGGKVCVCVGRRQEVCVCVCMCYTVLRADRQDRTNVSMCVCVCYKETNRTERTSMSEGGKVCVCVSEEDKQTNNYLFYAGRGSNPRPLDLQSNVDNRSTRPSFPLRQEGV